MTESPTQIHEEDVDLNRGVTMRRGPTDSWVYMYKDTPGVYFDQGGFEIGYKDAEAAGFPVEAQLKASLVARKTEAFTKALERLTDEKSMEIVEKLSTMSVEQLADIVSEQVEEAIPDLETDNDCVTDRGPGGEPRGTERHIMRHKGAGSWRVLNRESGDIVLDGCVKSQAIDCLIRQATVGGIEADI
jgi:hypothetical protein